MRGRGATGDGAGCAAVSDGAGSALADVVGAGAVGVGSAEVVVATDGSGTGDGDGAGGAVRTVDASVGFAGSVVAWVASSSDPRRANAATTMTRPTATTAATTIAPSRLRGGGTSELETSGSLAPMV